MDFAALVVGGFYALCGIIVIVLILYLAFRRVEIKKKENFEKRDN